MVGGVILLLFTAMTKLCLTTYFDKNFTPLGERCLKSLQIYAQRHNYSVEINNNIRSNRPPSWNKILLIQNLLKKYDCVLWVDADALFTRFDLDITQELEPDKDLYLARIKTLPVTNPAFTPNLGVILIKNTPWSQKLLDDLWQMEQYTNHLWWEQAAFLDFCGLVKNLPLKWKILFDKQAQQKPLNQTILEKIKWLHPHWNNFGTYKERISQPIIRHFTGRNYYWKLLRMIYYGHKQ